MKLSTLSPTLEALKPAAFFVLKLVLIYIAWRLFSTLVGAEGAPLEEQVWPWLTLKWEAFNNILRDNLIFLSEELLNVIGFETYSTEVALYIQGGRGVTVGHYCLALQLWVLFVALIAVYPAPWKHKLWFIPAGLIFIHILNVLRITAINLMTIYTPNHVDFNHHFTFRAIVFGFILLMYWFFIKRYGSTKSFG